MTLREHSSLGARLIPTALLLFSGALDPTATASEAANQFSPQNTSFTVLSREIALKIKNHTELSFEDIPVIAIGPIDAEEAVFPVDVEALRDALRVEIHQLGTGRVRMTDEEPLLASEEQNLRQVVESNYYSDDTDFAPAAEIRPLRDAGRNALLLIGKVRSDVEYSAETKTVTYQFNFRLGNSATGLLEWAGDFSHRTSGPTPKEPYWYSNPPGPTDRFLYGAGRASGETSEDSARAGARSRAKDALRSAALSGIEDAVWVEPNDVNVSLGSPEPAVSRTDGSRPFTAWMLLRAEQSAIQPFREAIGAVAQKVTEIEHLQASVRSYYQRADLAGASRAILEIRSAVDAISHGMPGINAVDYARCLLAESELLTGNPFQAKLEWQRVIESGLSPKLVARAKESLNRLTIDEKARQQAHARALFGGRKVHLLAAYRDESGTVEPWPKAGDLVAAHVGGAAGFIERRQVPAANNADFSKFAQSLSEEDDFSGVFVFFADGRFYERPNPESMTGNDVHFSGRVTIEYWRDGRLYRSVEKVLRTGWNRFGREMCMDMLAISIWSKWKEGQE